KTAMARCKLAQYAQPQNDFSTGSRTFQVCFAVLKIIFRPSLYANLLTPITVFRIMQVWENSVPRNNWPSTQKLLVAEGGKKLG
ncbi:MAG: hypothetical protein ACH346_07525, partial [Chthoniobacterales bacterium]